MTASPSKFDSNPYVFAAHNHTYLLVVALPEGGLEDDTEPFDFLEDMIEKHAVVGWEVRGTWAAPLGVYSVQCQYGAAVLLPCGKVADFDGGMTHNDIDDWAVAVMARIRNGGTNRRALMRGQVDADTVASDNPEDSPAIDSFGWSGRAVAPLHRMGVKVLADFSAYARTEIRDTKGVSAEAFWLIESAMIRNDIPWKRTGVATWNPKRHIGPAPEGTDAHAAEVAAGLREIPAEEDEDDLNDLV